MIVSNYMGVFDAELMSFSFELVKDNNWMAQMLDEVRLVVVSSLSDLVSGAVFALGITATTASMKRDITLEPVRGVASHMLQDQIVPISSNVAQLNQLFLARSHTTPTTNIGDNEEHPGNYKCLDATEFWCYNAHLSNRTRCTIFNFVLSVFFVWGALVLALHVQAPTSLVECSPKVYCHGPQLDGGLAIPR
ncbi:hypothetical protein GQ600_6471 [Phytophthora cactorum]|nr:hypothetical protein GQ600_6471 [Phytophthora cactorum]